MEIESNRAFQSKCFCPPTQSPEFTSIKDHHFYQMNGWYGFILTRVLQFLIVVELHQSTGSVFAVAAMERQAGGSQTPFPVRKREPPSPACALLPKTYASRLLRWERGSSGIPAAAQVRGLPGWSAGWTAALLVAGALLLLPVPKPRWGRLLLAWTGQRPSGSAF